MAGALSRHRAASVILRAFGIVAVIHGLTAVVGGACLAMDHEADAGGYRFWPQDWNSMETIAIVVGLWIASVLAYLGGDCYIAESRRKIPRQEAP